MPQLSSIDHLVLTVRDVARTCDFYREVLGMEVVTFRPADGTERKALAFESQKINLHQAGAEFEPKAERPQPGSADLCFLSATPVADWVAHFGAQGVAVIEGPVRRTGATGPILSVYIRDPDGNLIEVSNRQE